MADTAHMANRANVTRYYKVNTNTNLTAQPLVFKMFAAPGIDSVPTEVGVFNSGAALAPDHPTAKASPTDWANESVEQNYSAGRLVGNYEATQAKGANSIAIRRRGLAPFGGFFAGKQSLNVQHLGGIVDHNAGADHLIAGGPSAAATFCRVNITQQKHNRGAKLPIMPRMIQRGKLASIPAGGGSHEPLVAPLQPKVSGWPTIFSFTKGARSA